MNHTGDLTHRFLATAMLLGILALALAGNGLRLRTPDVHAQSTPNDSLLLQLAERLLGSAPPVSVPYQSASQAVQLLPGGLPSDLPLNLPMPPGSTLLGSSERPSYPLYSPTFGGPGGFVATPQQRAGNRIDIVLDATQMPEDVITFYKGAMSGLGWTSPPTPAYPGPQPPQLSQTPTATFCQSTSGPWLSVSAATPDNGATDVRIHLENGTPGTCTAQPTPPYLLSPSSPPFGLLPSLRAPDGVTVRTVGGVGGGQGRFASDAIATTVMSLTDLYTAYARQLTAAGWSQTDSGQSSSLTWSAWSIPDHTDYQGFLYVRSGPPAGQFSLHAEVATTDPNAPQSGPVYYSGSGAVSTITNPVGAGTGALLPALSSPTATATPAAGR